MRRFVIYDHLGNVVHEVSPNDVFTLTRREKINGEHALEITTTQVLEKNQRIVYQDGRGYWREYVVSGVDAEHVAGKTVLGVYYCTWSLQSDLLGVTVSKMPGVQTPVTAANALADALSTQTRWTVGTVTNTNTGGASMYDMSAWQALGVLIENWQGELSTSFDVDVSGNITARRVDYYAQMGEQTAKRRFDFGADVKSIKRKYDDEPLYCRVSPRGAGEQTEGGGYGRKITIESVNDGKDYLVYAPMVDVAKLPDGNGGWQYPTVIIENSNCKTPTELKTWAQSVLEESCTPKVTYEVDVYEAAIEGVDAQGVSLGDAVQVVDRKFGAEGLRLQARVIELAVDELNERNVTVTLGYVDDGLAGQFADGARAFSMVTNLSNTLSTAQYVKDLISRMNDEINATGGYTYITEGQGIRAYDVAVTDPLVGAEASKVVEIKGGSIRIANSKTAQGEWEWKSVFVSGHIAAELVTAANLTAGRITVRDGSNNILFDANMDTRAVTVAGFTAIAQAFYSGLSSLTGTDTGVYVGTNGIACSTLYDDGSGNQVQHSIAFSGGGIEGRYQGDVVGYITPNATATGTDENDNPVTLHGLQMRGDVIDLRADKLTVKGDGGSDGDSIVALEDRTVYSSYLAISAYDANVSVTMRPTERRRRIVNGMAVSDTSYWYSILGNKDEQLVLSTKKYVDDRETAVKSYIDEQLVGKPTFRLSGTTLYITTE